jgi:hypothetical protein
MALSAASKKAEAEVNKRLSGGRRIRVNGFGTHGVRLSGKGHCSGGAMKVSGSGMYAAY